MARTNIPLSTLSFNGQIDIVAGTAYDNANKMNIQLPSTGIPSAPQAQDLFLYLTNTDAADHVVTIEAGVGGGSTPGAAFRSGLGNLAITVHHTPGGVLAGPFEAARFAQLDGSINITPDSGSVGHGTVVAYVRPRNF